jgi:PBSX family phage terminase large subunit
MVIKPPKPKKSKSSRPGTKLTKYQREKLKKNKALEQNVKALEKALESFNPLESKHKKKPVVKRKRPLPEVAQEFIEEVQEAAPEIPKGPKILWEPKSQVQIDFLSSWEDEVLFSGGRGSGKSDCLLVDPLRWITNKNFRGLIIRKTMPDLRDLIKRCRLLYPEFAPGTKWKEQEKMFVFPSGATIEFGYCENEEDLERYRGQQYTWIGIDEITQFPWADMVDKLKACLRSTDPTIPLSFRATTNPSGVGTAWVKARWISLGTPGKTITKIVEAFGKTFKVTRKWFNSTIMDNPALLESNPNYVASLVGDNETLRKQWLYGEWVSDGLAFDEFSLKTHVVEPFKIPNNWYKFRACDWGYSSMAVCLWFAVDYEGNLFVYRELKTKGVTADKFAEMVLEREHGEGVHYGILDASVWSQRGQIGETPADTMIRMGCYWTPSDSSKGSRVAGKQLMHQYLAKDAITGEPRLKIFSHCTELIKELSDLPLDPNNPEDVDTKACDHAYDACRYGVASRPQIKSQYYDSFMQGIPIGRNQEVMIDSTFGY